MSIVDLTGLRVGRLLVLSIATPTKDKKSRWNCACDCGNHKVIRAAVLSRAGARSCGCLQSEEQVRRTRTHGMTGSREWNSWRAMTVRCNDDTDPCYRDVLICEQWADFECFLKDMGPRPPDTTLNRLDNTRGYEPSNCVWSTIYEQNRNRRSNVKLTNAEGVTKLAADWARILGTSQTTISERIKRGWSESDAVTIQVRRFKSHV